MKKTQEITFFSKGLFEKPFMDSRIKTASMTMKEKLLGYLVGPFGTLAFMAVLNQLVELYYTEIFYIDKIFGVGTYLLMSWATKAVAVVCGILAAYVVERNVSSQGRFRPLILIGSLVSAVAGFFMFWIPDMPDAARLVWIYIFNILYNGVGVTLFNLRSNMFTLCTRDQNDRNQINLFNNMSGYLFVGTAITLVIGSVLYYTMLHGYPAENWIVLVGITAAGSIPLSLIQYFYSKERITEENDSAGQRTPASIAGIGRQIKCLFSSKYWVLAALFGTAQGISNCLSGYNLNTNFCTIVLGATIENSYSLIYTVASGIPLGLGILMIYPLSKRFTIRKTTMFFSVFAILGCAMGLVSGARFWPAAASNFIYNMGTLPVIYIVGALTAAANDDVEYKYGFRLEGTIASALVGSVVGIVCGAFAGVYETGLSATGYEPELGMAQPGAVYRWIYFIKYVVPIIFYAVTIVIMYFMDLEKHLPAMQEEIRQRHKAAAEARGEVWLSPEELAEQERIENARLAELARREDLEKKRRKKG